MANAELAPGALAKPVKGTAAKLKAQGRRFAATMCRLVYSLVDLRDRGICRACKRFVGLENVHRHHLRGRKFTTLADVCHLCERCHSWLHVRVGGKRLKLSGNADQVGGLRAWWRRDDGGWDIEDFL